MRLRGLTALACLSYAVAIGPNAAAATLAPAHLGIAASAPAPPLVGGEPPSSVRYVWQRCLRYSTLVDADGASDEWRMNDSTATAADALGAAPGTYLGSHATVADGALFGEGDPAAAFDGRTSALSVPDAPDYGGTRPYSIELWVRPRTIDASFRFLFAREQTTSAGRQGTGIWLSRTGLGFERWRDGVASTVHYGPGLPLGAWSHVTATYDGHIMRLYVNGALLGSREASASLLAEPGPTEIGAGAGGHAGFFSGELDEVASYPRALIRSHVGAHHAAATTAPCATIAAATGPTYVPVLADLGRALSVTVTSSNSHGSASVSGQGTGLVDDGHGNYVRASIGGLTANGTASGTVQVTATLAGLPADRVEWDVDGQYRYAKPGEAPYRYTWYTAAESNAPHTVAVKVWGPNASIPAISEVAVHTSNPTLHPTPLPFGEESAYAEMNEGDEASARNLLDNVWPARGYPLPHLNWPLTWQEDPYHEAFWEFYFYGLRPEATLLYEWEKTGYAPYLEKLIAILRSYTAYDRTRGENRVTFDNNHTSAYRAMELVNFYVKLKIAGVLPKDLEEGLARSLVKLGGFLAEARHFEADFNHGFNEGAALLLLADNFPHMPGAAGWRTLALERLKAMLANTIDADGVEVENSPFYQVYVLGLVYQISQWAERYEPTLAAPYSEAATKMLRYTAEITQPNGYLPMLGATATTYMPSQDPNVYGPMAAADPEFDFAFTRGAKGTPPPDGTVLFPVSGQFVMRSPLGATSNLPNQTYVTFNAGTYRTNHSDLDALGMTMYSNGSTVLPTSGLYTYTEEPWLEYFHGTRSDNTVVVDGKNQAQGSAQAGSHGSAGGATWASGVSGLYAGVSHHRTVVVLRQGLTLVLDALASSVSHRYAQTWHMAPGSAVRTAGADTYVTNAAGTPTLTIRQADAPGLTVGSAFGATEPIQGWYSNGYGAKQQDWALEDTRTGPNALFTTLLAAGPYAGQASTITETPLAGGHRVNICVGGTVGYSVTIPIENAAKPTITAGACPAPVVSGSEEPAREPLPTPTLTLSSADEAAFRPLPARANAVPVLLFHSVCPTSGCTSYNATPDEFARMMLMLSRAGYHTISIAQYAKWWHGEAATLPDKPILLCFDDARLDGYRGADRTLAALGDLATVFVITGEADARNPKYLRWDELARMQATGRWSVQLHAHEGHVTIPVGVEPGGGARLKPFYGWRQYDPGRHPSGEHLESHAEWRYRAEGDVAQGEAELAAHVPGYQPIAFAVPFGDYGQFHTNDASIPSEFSLYLSSHFGVFFTQPHPDPDFTTPGEEPWRYTIRSTTTAPQLYAWLAEHAAQR
ncbi:MAG TPA: heparinase II/III family protein [Solirubrobacteraceae bacterium]|nr:heparinase II/III family protein [Solirubrobacteraceae bacterium]